MTQLTPETRFDDYRLLECLGRGGMGEVWRARDMAAERDVAIKFVPPDIQNAEDEMERVRSMFHQVHGLQHQHICPLYVMKTTPGFGTYIVMKYIPGMTLSKYALEVRRVKNRFPLAELIEILEPVAGALDYAHSQQVIHRDVKPGNVMVVLDALERVTDVQLIDFGLAATFRASMSRVSQQKMNTSGTRPYMAPEQWTSAYQGAATDQYALGVSAYEILAGDFPFNMPDVEALRLSVLHDPPQPIPGQPPYINAAISRAMAKDRKARFPSCAAFVEAMKSGNAAETIISGVYETPPPAASPVTPPPEYATIVSHAAEPREEVFPDWQLPQDKTFLEHLSTTPILPPAKTEMGKMLQHFFVVFAGILTGTLIVRSVSLYAGILTALACFGFYYYCRRWQPPKDAESDEKPQRIPKELPVENSSPGDDFSQVAPRNWQPPHHKQETRPSLESLQETVDALERARKIRRTAAKIILIFFGVMILFGFVGSLGRQSGVIIQHAPPARPVARSSTYPPEHGPFFPWEDRFYENAGEEDENIERESAYEPGQRMVKAADGVEFAFRWCPPGEFLMGSPDDERGRGNMEPQHEVTLTRGFWMLETEVTQQIWETIMGSNPSEMQGPTLPVENVSWLEAHEFCRRLTEKLQVCVLLPTEAQWEYACRAGTTGPHAGKLDEMAWYANNAEVNNPKPVGKKSSNPWGLYDMHGNVAEWCRDWRGRFSFTAVNDPVGPYEGTQRIFRGGSRGRNADSCRSAARDAAPPDYTSNTLGFRIVLGKGTENSSPAPL